MKKVILVIVDGLGLSKRMDGNAFALAKTPTFDKLFKEYPNCIVEASGSQVGLPKKQMGNSEVGHLNIGAGRVVYTGLSLINKAIESKEFEKNKVFLDTFEDVKKNNSTLHFVGLLSDGGVHSSENHLFELINLAHKNKLTKVSIHPFGDGRDVGPKSILSSLKKLVDVCEKYKYKISTIGGRFYGMDRDKIFERTNKHYEALLGNSQNQFIDVINYVKKQYSEKITDEFLIPACSKDGDFIKDNDSVIFFNFRPDRARQLTHLFIGSDLYREQPLKRVKLNNFISMMKYEGINSAAAFSEMVIKKPLGKVLEEAGKKQLRISETQKYAHVTYFLDGGRDIEYKNSKRIMIPSIKAESFDTCPEMSGKKITQTVLEKANDYDVTVINYPNPDMVGHTGNLPATIKAVDFIDGEIKKILEFANKNNITVFITADHGNAEEMISEDGKILTKHSTSPVMFISSDKNIKLKNGRLANIAPTILDYLGIKKPTEMDHDSLINNE